MEKYVCPHCGKQDYKFFAYDGDMGLGGSWRVYKCSCGRVFDEPLKGNIGLSRS